MYDHPSSSSTKFSTRSQGQAMDAATVVYKLEMQKIMKILVDQPQV